MSEKYRKVEGGILESATRGVLYWSEKQGEAVQFWCPCGERLVYCTSPPHTIEFDDAGVVASLGGSCGYKANEDKGRPSNWCHFTVTDGRAKIHGDAKCPGGDGSIP